MQEEDITTPEALDTALAARANSRTAELWKAAEGRAFRWPDAVGLTLGALLVVSGLVGWIAGEERAGVLVALGVLIVYTFMIVHLQKQIAAVCDLLKRFDRER